MTAPSVYRRVSDDETDPSVPSESHTVIERTFPPRSWAVALFGACTLLLFADQNLMAPNLTQIADYFHFDDQERDQKLGGDISLAFFVLGAPASLVVGLLGDHPHLNRSKLFAATVLVGEGACLATYFTTTYAWLYTCRAITGFALGGALPLIYSILGDLYRADERHSVSALVGIGTGAGISVGQAVAGFTGPSYGWRLPFLIISVPALICALLVYWTVPDPERGAMEEAVLRLSRRVEMTSMAQPSAACSGSSSAPSSSLRETDVAETQAVTNYVPTSPTTVSEYWSIFQHLLSTKTVLLALAQGAPGCVPWGIVNAFLNDYLSENRGMTVQHATAVVMIFGVGNFFGLLLGGTGGSRLYRINVRLPSLLAGTSAILGCLPFWLLLNTVDKDSSWWYMVLVAVSGGLWSGVTGPIVKATLANVTLPQTRGQAFALFNTFDDFGRGLGPVFVSRIIAFAGGRRVAFNWGVLGWILCGVFNLLMFCTVQRDERMIQEMIERGIDDEECDFVVINTREGMEDEGSDGVIRQASSPTTTLSKRSV